MIVSWNWLKDYVALDLDREEVERRLMMAGLNHESTDAVDDDWAIDLEVTSNRPDCLGHIGVAREISVLFELPLEIPTADPPTNATPVSDLTKVRIDCPELCWRYTARLIRGAKIGPSPDWLARRLKTVGLAVINNVVDVTNYVLMECGQPLHAFDFAKLAGRRIVVREAKPGETLVAIDHREYALEPGMCVIADAESAVALGGVMGGAATEVSAETADLLIESAEFAPLSIRTTARKLGLHSPSSYRFERGVDPEGVDWASRRCCELILELAGGELADGVIDVGRPMKERAPIVLRLEQLPRILGIDVPVEKVREILVRLGNEVASADRQRIEVVAPSWRKDLTREIDLVEEVARIYGYEKIPEDASVPMCPSHRSDFERCLEKVHRVVTAAGFDEAMTPTFVPHEWSEAFSLWTSVAPLVAETAMKGVLADAPQDLSPADQIRRSLVPSLLEARRYNESLQNAAVELFEIAKVFLPREGGLPVEQWTLGLASGRDYLTVKGAIEQLVTTLNPDVTMELAEFRHDLFDSQKSCELSLQGRLLGFLGELTESGRKRFGLRAHATCAELNLEVLADITRLTARYVQPSPYPAITRDLNLIVDETIRWADLATTVQDAAGEILETIEYRETYRNPKKDGTGKKRLFFSVTLRSRQRTLTNEEADEMRNRIVAQCEKQHGARLLG